MFIRRKKYPSGNIGVIVVEKTNGKMKELATIGIAQNQDELGALLSKGREWISKEQERRHPRLDLFGEERSECESELLNAEQMLSCITNIFPSYSITSVSGISIGAVLHFTSFTNC